MQPVVIGTNHYPELCAFVGGFVLIFGLVSFVVKEKAFLSDSLVATLIGIAFGPLSVKLLDPTAWADLNLFILQFTDLLINIQIMAATIALTRDFWKSRWKTMLIFLGPVMIFMWLVTAVILYLLLPISWFNCMILAACMAPTDPILANSIVNGRFADLHIHHRLRQLLSAESACNDGAALPFFFLGALLMRYPTGEAIGRWVYMVFLYEMGVAIVLGVTVGFLAHVSLKYSETHNLIDKKNFLTFEIALAVFVSGLANMFHLSSFIATFATAFVFSWDGWFAEETEEAHVQGVIDMLINLVFFIFFGAAIPWKLFNSGILSIDRLIGATVLILVFRRLPIVMGLFKTVRSLPIMSWQEAFFVGWFGPIGVGALWYMAHYLKKFPEEADLFNGVIFFIVLVSVIVHGIMVPIVHMTIVRTRTASRQPKMSVPQWPTGLSMNTNMISGPIIENRETDSTNIPGPSTLLTSEEAVNQV